MPTTTERMLLALSSNLHSFTELIMATLDELQTRLDELTALANDSKTAADEAAADAARHAALTQQAVDLLRAQAAAIAELQAGAVTQAQLDAVVAKAADAATVLQGALDTMSGADTARDLADSGLAAEVTPPAP